MPESLKRPNRFNPRPILPRLRPRAEQYSISDLRIFVGVVKAGSVSGASRHLNLSPASISKRLSRLERNMGIRLLNRSSRAMSLTNEGRHLYQRMLKLLDEMEEAMWAASNPETPPRGLLRVAASTSFGKARLALLASEFAHRYPEVTVQVYAGDHRFMEEFEDADLSITLGPPSDSSMIAQRLITNRTLLCAAPRYLSSRPAPRRPADLKKHDCLILDARGSFRDLWPLCGPSVREQVRVHPGLVTDNADTLREWTLRGYGIAIQTEWHVRNELRSGQLVPVMVDYALPNMDFFAVYSSTRSMPNKVRHFLEFLQERIGRL